jgi:hypothetical protein
MALPPQLGRRAAMGILEEAGKIAGAIAAVEAAE